jgi:hypothetical protein
MKAGTGRGACRDGGFMAMQSVVRNSYNGRRISEPVRKDKGNTTATEPEDKKDPKRARVVLSKDRELDVMGYSRLTGAATKVTDRGVSSGKLS